MVKQTGEGENGGGSLCLANQQLGHKQQEMIQLANMWDEWWSIEDIGNADIIRPVKHWELTTNH